MVATHLFPAFTSAGELHPAYQIAAGRAAALFAVLAGLSLGLAHGAARPPRARGLAAARLGILGRVAVLFALGMLLGEVDSPPLVILAYYALLFVLLLPFLGAGRRVLVGSTVVALLVLPQLSQVLRQWVPEAPIDEPGGAQLPFQLLLTGTYPALTWLAYGLAGLALSRLALQHARTQLALLTGGTAVAVTALALASALLDRIGGADSLGGLPISWPPLLLVEHGLFGTTPTEDWRWLLLAAPHSGSTLDLAATTGSSVAVIGGCLLLVRVLPRPLVIPPAAAGSMTLTLYTAHVLVVAQGSPLRIQEPFRFWAVQLAVALVVATVWRQLVGRGPLETLAHLVDRWLRSWATGRRLAVHSR